MSVLFYKQTGAALLLVLLALAFPVAPALAEMPATPDTTSGGLSRLEWSVGAETDAVILELGANDALRGIDPSVTQANLAMMIKTLQARSIKVLLVGMLAPPNMGREYADAFNPIYPDLARRFDLDLYPFFLDGVAANPKHTLADGMHPNPEGVAVMVKGILPKVETLLLPSGN